MSALYNEIDPYAGRWLRNLIHAGHIAKGTTDERSIKDLTPKDLDGFTQFHAFAGIGVWSHALRLAGWPDDRPVWTGSCPCQPFSVAGRGKGTDDPRHFWPDWFRLIRECSPPVVFGEQVASRDGRTWLDAVRADLEGVGYAFAAADLCAAGIGAPHIRQRLYFVGTLQGGLAHHHHHQQGRGQFGRIVPEDRDAQPRPDIDGRGEARRLADAREGGRRRGANVGRDERNREDGRRPEGICVAESRGAARGLGHANCEHAGRDAGAGDCAEGGPRLRGGGDEPCAPGPTGGLADDGRDGLEGRAAAGQRADAQRSTAERGSPTSGFWAGPDWVPCRDGKIRPVEPGSFPLAHGAPARMGRLRAYGNAIVSEVAAAFIRAVMEAT